MRHPWQTWLIFSLCLALAVGAMGWLTHQALELDRAEVAARKELDDARRKAETLQAQAETEELISTALWRMDTALAPVLAQEAARPYFVYRPFYTAPTEAVVESGKGVKGAVSYVPSPLLQYSTPHVRLHFQLGPESQLSSPQCPVGRWRDRAMELGIAANDLDQSADRLLELNSLINPAELLACLPEQRLPELHLGEYAFDVNTTWNFKLAQNGNRFNTIDPNNETQQQRAIQQSAQPNPAPFADPPVQQEAQPAQQPLAPPANSPARPTAQPPQGAPGPSPVTAIAGQGGQSQGQGSAGQSQLEQTLDGSQYDVPARNTLNSPGYYVNRNPDREQQRAERNNERGQEPGRQQSEAQSPTAYLPVQPLPTQQVGVQPQGNSGQQAAEQGQSPGQAGAYVANAGNLDNELRLQNSRGGGKFDDRSRVYQNYAQQALVQQRKTTGENRELGPRPQLQLVSEGVSRPVWVGNQLFLARRVKIGEEIVIQGCWIDWAGLKEQLLAEVSDLLPEAELVPVATEENLPLSRLLATLPVQIRVPAAAPVAAAGLGAPAWESPVKVALWIAWPCLVVAAGAIAALLLGVVSLSERRAAFVAAVTHELRTPLTTFRMYAEMLADGMVTDEDRKQQYLDTLRVEADRLSHLVENVLLYARLERGPSEASRQNLSLAELLDRSANRLRDRAKLAGMELVIAAAPDAKQAAVRTDPVAVEQVLFNLIDNACKYAVAANDKRLHLELSATSGVAQFRVRDHGPGLSRDAAARLFEPFSKSAPEAAVSAPGVGLGLALSKRLATDLGGDLVLEQSSEGAAFVLSLPRVANPER